MSTTLRFIWIASVYASLGCSAAAAVCSCLDGPDRFDRLAAQGRFAYAAATLACVSVVALLVGVAAA